MAKRRNLVGLKNDNGLRITAQTRERSPNHAGGYVVEVIHEDSDKGPGCGRTMRINGFDRRVRLCTCQGGKPELAA
jgi:hypothetical protein